MDNGSDQTIFVFGGWEPVARILVVGTVSYAVLVLLLRVSGKRTLARLNALDFIITVAIGAVFGRVLTARSVALVEALTAFALLAFLQYLVSWIQIRFPAVVQAVTASPSLLFFRGQFLRETMRRERIAEAELRSAIREQGLGSFDEVEAVVLESDGRFAVIRASSAGSGSALDDLRGD